MPRQLLLLNAAFQGRQQVEEHAGGWLVKDTREESYQLKYRKFNLFKLFLVNHSEHKAGFRRPILVFPSCGSVGLEDFFESGAPGSLSASHWQHVTGLSGTPERGALSSEAHVLFGAAAPTLALRVGLQAC